MSREELLSYTERTSSPTATAKEGRYIYYPLTL
jgi:hypothetical protein